MKRVHILLLTCFCLFASSSLHAEEFLCNVSINASRIQSDKTVFDNMRETITQYINFQTRTSIFPSFLFSK